MYNTAYRLYTVAYCLIVGGADDAIDAEEADADEAGDEADDDADDAPRDVFKSWVATRYAAESHLRKLVQLFCRDCSRGSFVLGM